MPPEIPATSLQLHSTVKTNGTLELSLVEAEIPALGDNDVLVKVGAAPINPSDMGLMFGPAEMGAAVQGGSAERPTLTAKIPEPLMKTVSARVGQSMPCGNEGAGTVVAAGASEAAQALTGRTVATLGGSMYSDYRAVPLPFCLLLPEGTTAEQGASCFVNPLTALGMTETMRLEGHTALVHTAAASNLGQMLVKICAADGIPLVNVVRKREQAEMLRGLGAKYVVDSSEESFRSDLVDALAETGATLAFDATGGGKLASNLLGAMESALSRGADFSRYGSDTHKQVYIYGGLERTPTTLDRNFGMAWGIGGWLLPPFLQRIGPEAGQRLRDRVASEVTTTFASHYTRRVSLAEALTLENVAAYGRQATGEKTLITP
ncbi:MAG: zinc-binding dehydrogenase [Myxococcota bacterium]|nr:zinc-binding dehydrogenase [Myxococcota bacterium]